MRRVAGLLGILLCAALAGAVRPEAARAEPPKADWERVVEQESAEQTALIEQARPRKAMGAVVTKYQSRASRDPSALNHYLLGRALYYDDDPVGAKTQMTLALEEDPGFYFAHLRLALLYLDLKNYAETEREAAAVLAVRPGQPEALEVMAKSAVEQKDWDRALRFLDERLARDPADLAARRILAGVQMQRNDWAAAEREWRLLAERDPSVPTYRLLHAVCRRHLGALDAAAAELEAVARDRPGDLQVLDELREVYVLQKDTERVRATVERMLPHLGDEERKEAVAYLETLKAAPTSSEAPDVTRQATWDAVFEAAKGPDRDRRERALRAIYEGCELGHVRLVPGRILQGITSDVEPDPACRAWVVRIMGCVPASVLPVLALGLHDEDQRVRMLAAETIGDLKEPAGLLYLLPFLEVGGIDVVEYESVRAAVASVVGQSDLPPGTTSVVTPADVEVSREAWRRWRLTDASTPLKLKAIDQFATLKEPQPERYLFELAMDPAFDVMRVAYVAMRRAVARAPYDPVEKKVFPHFPVVSDAEVTRASMTSLQERVRAWWEEWLAERRAYLRAKRGGATPPK